jgi:hypothetical protein
VSSLKLREDIALECQCGRDIISPDLIKEILPARSPIAIVPSEPIAKAVKFTYFENFSYSPVSVFTVTNKDPVI